MNLTQITSEYRKKLDDKWKLKYPNGKMIIYYYRGEPLAEIHLARPTSKTMTLRQYSKYGEHKLGTPLRQVFILSSNKKRKKEYKDINVFRQECLKLGIIIPE